MVCSERMKNRTPHAVDVMGGRSSAIIRRMSAKKIFGNGDFGHLKRDIAAMADDLRADLDQLFLQARQRPLLTWGGPGQGGLDSVAHK